MNAQWIKQSTGPEQQHDNEESIRKLRSTDDNQFIVFSSRLIILYSVCFGKDIYFRAQCDTTNMTATLFAIASPAGRGFAEFCNGHAIDRRDEDIESTQGEDSIRNSLKCL